jgi:hypothetical protein
MALKLFALLGVVFAVPVVSKCNFFGSTGIDYADSNLSLVTINSSSPLSSCCDACTAWNKDVRRGNCTIGVLLTRAGKDPICALKASTLHPFNSTHTTAVQPGGAAFPNLDLIILPNDTSIAHGAMCLDGSPPAIYMKSANLSDPSAANKWVLYFKGGGWCFDNVSCAGRAKGLIGSSTQLQAKQPTFGYEGGGPLGGDPASNPDFAHFNRVMLWYCDGGSFTGDRTEPLDFDGQKLYFRGKRNLDAVLRYLRRDHNLNAATEILLAGGSAGGLSAYIHADYIRSTFAPSVKFRASPVSGFFLMHDTAQGVPDYPTSMRNMFDMMNSTGGANQRCVTAAPAGQEWQCVFANASYAYTRTPIFPMNSAVDSYQMEAILQVPAGCASMAEAKVPGPQFSNCTSTELAQVIAFEGDFIRDLQGSVTYSRPGNGGFIESCMEHCAAQGNRWNQIKQSGVTIQEAHSKWWNAADGAPASEHWHLPCTLNAAGPGQCNPSCQ